MLGGLHPLDGGELVWHGAEQTVLSERPRLVISPVGRNERIWVAWR